jgi:CelD/BcsL family acetyltransferase involved in cellulose biosynthesis
MPGARATLTLTAMIHCSWIAFAELEHRRPEWRRLAAESEFPTAFADPAWVLAWWNCFGEGAEPWTFAAEDAGGAFRGLAMLALGKSRLTRSLIFAGGGWNGLQTLVCSPGVEDEFSGSLIQALAERRSEWDIWRIQRLPTDSSLAKTLLGGGDALRAAAHDLRLQPYVELPADMETYEARFGSKQRNTQRRKWRKLTELGASARLIEDPSEAESKLRPMLELRRSRAQELRQRYKHMDVRYERFLQSAVAELLPERARVWTLELDGAMLASRLNLIQGTREHSYLLGLGTSHRNLSPGNSLELQAINSAIVQGRTELALGPGRDAYKYRLGARDRELAQMVVSSPTFHGRAATGIAAADLRLRDTAAAEALRRRMGLTPERGTLERPAREGSRSQLPMTTAGRD